MAKIIVCLVLFVVVAGHKHHPKFPKTTEDYIIPMPRKVACSGDNERERGNIIEQSKCGEPKEVFEYLKVRAAHEQISPRAVWVKRCVGLCEYENEGTCVATETAIRHIPIRIYNAKTNKETCATYPIVEHVSCGCCSLSPEECAAPRVYNPRKCSCQCPNMEERRNCLKKRNQNMRWNRSKCACEQRRRA
ncbi:uncharacterized protein LOC110375215 isoform X1 [Helicoverpa armigera]|uniref:Platelet-derived growth factor (PDGF) family profile domain-containing protein n=1 Tax=Helicoverpa armigera TaxID=29058 RepID=A0A2W1C0P6_HELAM|nr:uncharacterized protein LOC110375215 isoform X1 [Helicoverpa armigera]XP_047023567.1 uncharacterized protein LOC124632674 isoform X1 [Helicoverpa zea]PZC79067.1 hypothetical protein B5X24_HaOG216882 [Helicoverpa armigera]